MKCKALFLLLLLPLYSVAQNLVPNPSFEEYEECPEGSQIDLATGWTSANFYSPDYFNACANNGILDFGVPSNYYGTQSARSGVAYAGIYLPVTSGNSLREYIQTELTESLITGVEYSVKFYVSLAENYSDYSVNSLGIYFSTTAINSPDNTVLNLTPQIVNNGIDNPLVDKINWKEISGTYTAIGGEKFIVLGNFQSDVIVDTTYLAVIPNDLDNCYYYIEDVSVEINVTDINDFSFDNIFSYYPNPADNRLNIQFNVHGDHDVKILDIMGKVIFSFENINGYHTINLTGCSNGIYFLQLSQNNKGIITKSIIVNH